LFDIYYYFVSTYEISSCKQINNLWGAHFSNENGDFSFDPVCLLNPTYLYWDLSLQVSLDWRWQ
ncbi:MAG TPA: hypothetical protein VI727_05965, partial [Candidatus Brocadiaceae bacterium]|nr:hypothetical protein [Candidatus Brocadiaceae bacterium]